MGFYGYEPNVSPMSLIGVCKLKMLEWREREHRDDDDNALQDVDILNALKQCGLLKYFMAQCMRKLVALLEMIMGMWDINDQALDVGPHIFKLEIKDIYFLTELSKRGDPLVLGSHREIDFSIEDYIAEYCREGTHKVSGKIP